MRFWASLLAGIACITFWLATHDARAADPPRAPTSLFDPRLDKLRKASVSWSTREAGPRAVVDVVCLVPDLPTFLEVIGTWDSEHYFPVLIDDADYSLKFLRAF